jgi:hypothetical protein
MDTLDTSPPDNRYLFGCADNNGNSYSAWVFRMLSIGTAVPNVGSNPLEYRIMKINAPDSTSLWYCQDTKALS